MWRSFFRPTPGGQARARVLRVTSSFFLHVHPIKVRRHALSLRFTWGMGGISCLLLGLLVVSGMLLMFHYRPTPEHALGDVARVASTGGGRLLRNLHRFGSHALVGAAALHGLRVFLTGSYKPPREANWVLGVVLLALVTLLAVTGHALLAPREALLQTYTLHTVVLPLLAALFSAVHFWRVRKDGGISGPPPSEPAASDLVPTWPHLVRVEATTAGVVVVALLVWAWLGDAPLTPVAVRTPPWLVGVALTVAGLGGLALLPFVDRNPRGNGVYSFRERPVAVSAALGVVLLIVVSTLAGR